MIVEFSVRNFRSIKDLQTISFKATGLKSATKYKSVDVSNIVLVDGVQYLKTIGLYGANASGKSNIVKAFNYFIEALTSQPSANSNLGNLCDPFMYQENPDDTESFFQIVFIVKNKKYRYGFTTKKNTTKRDVSNVGAQYSQEIVTNEWLYGTSNKNMMPMFVREGQNVKNTMTSDAGVVIPQELPYLHSLFLTHAAAFDSNGTPKTVIDYFSGSVINTEKSELNNRFYSLLYLQGVFGEDSKNEVIKLLNVFNLKYDNVFIQDEDDDSADKSKPKFVVSQDKIIFQKKYAIRDGITSVDLNLKNNESAGTQKLFDLAGMLLFILGYKRAGSPIVIIDEIDSNFHPSLLIKLIELFNTPSFNKANAQLLFTSHDTNLMSPEIMRRDQFYFSEKGQNQATRIYSLADLRGIRNGADFAKAYLAGLYGAIPVLQDYIEEK